MGKARVDVNADCVDPGTMGVDAYWTQCPIAAAAQGVMAD